MFFNYDNLHKVATEYTRYFIARNDLSPALQKYQFDSALTQQFPKLEPHFKRALWEYALKFILGIGYGTANFGLVLSAFPNEFDYIGLKEFLLAAVWLTNFSIGYNKMDTTVKDMRQLFADRCDTPVNLSDVEVVTIALQQFEKLAKKYQMQYAKSAGRVAIDARMAIKEKLAQMISLRNINPLLVTIKEQMIILQQQFDRPAMTDANHTAVLIPDDSTADEQLLLPLAPLDALCDPFYFRVLLPGEHPWAEKSLAVISISLSALAITSNVGGIASLAILQPLGSILCYLVGVLGSWGAYSLNKGVSDTWTKSFLATFQTNVVQATNVKQTFWRKYSPLASYQPIDYIGLVWSGYAATSGVYYTRDQVSTLFGTSLGARIFGYAAQAATGLMTTVTKAIPTARLLKPLVPSWCSGEKSDVPMTNKALRDFYNVMISGLLEKIITLIEAYKHAAQQLSEQRKIRYGLWNWKYEEFIRQINREISAPDVVRADVYQILITHYDEIREKVMTAYAALEIARDVRVGVPDAERRLAPLTEVVVQV
jgi:hypothetical protein